MKNNELIGLIDWCRQKLAYQKAEFYSDKYKKGYEDAMKAVMSKLHSEKKVTHIEEKAGYNIENTIEKIEKAKEVESAEIVVRLKRNELFVSEQMIEEIREIINRSQLRNAEEVKIRFLRQSWGTL